MVHGPDRLWRVWLTESVAGSTPQGNSAACIWGEISNSHAGRGLGHHRRSHAAPYREGPVGAGAGDSVKVTQLTKGSGVTFPGTCSC